MLSKKIRKEILYSKLEKLLKPKGYSLLNIGHDPRYIFKSETNVYFIFFNFNDNGSISTSCLLNSVNEVEDIILEIGIPTNDLLAFKEKKKYFLPTIIDKHFYHLFKQKYNGYSFKSEAEVQEFSDWLIHYLSTKGFAFVEHYSFLPNVLAKMNQLIEEGKYWAEILSGQVDNVFRGLIISKLCNDNEFGNKLKYWNEKIYANENIKEWIPYFEKLKEKLKTIEPKYNAEDGRVLNFEDIT